MNYNENDLFGSVDIAAVIRLFLHQTSTGQMNTKGLYPEQLGQFRLQVSFGMGNPANIPWIAMLGEEQKVSHGIYPVFLYYKANDHLILAYGLSEENRSELGWGTLVSAAPTIATQMAVHGFNVKRYGNSYVAAEYPQVSQLIQDSSFDQQVKNDLAEVLTNYRQVLKSFSVAEIPLLKASEHDDEHKDEALLKRSIEPLNQILYGPPGTGKTYHTIDKALAILDPDCLSAHVGKGKQGRQELKARFDELVNKKRVRFVTFHQSFSYEDFVEGLRADSDGESGQIEYRVEPGVFKRLCADACTQDGLVESGIRDNPRIWKISINGTGASVTKTYCLDHGEARIGWGNTGDLRQSPEQNAYYQSLGSGNQGTLSYFAEQIVVGDILLCIHSADEVGSIGVVTGDYRYEETVPAGVIGDYKHVRPVRWLYRDIKLSILPLNDNHQFTLKTVYRISRFTWADLLGQLQTQGIPPVDSAVMPVPARKRQPYVLIIDEINRGNVSRIFGELITLIEPSKRTGATEALSTVLPYSKQLFSVPDNLYLIGTMNTADRSLAGLDIALRRRFVFEEMPPRPDLLDEVEIEESGISVNIGALLRVMNLRIELLLDRDHCLGHAYFMSLKESEAPTLQQLGYIFKSQILPLLQEYFFEDWQRIAWVLNDHRKEKVDQFLQEPALDIEALLGKKVQVGHHQRWTLNERAFTCIGAYAGIIGTLAKAKGGDDEASKVAASKPVVEEDQVAP